MAKKHFSKRQSSGREPGTFKEKKLHYKRNAVIYESIRQAAQDAKENETSVVEIDNRRFFLLTADAAVPYVGLGFLKIPGRGIAFCCVCTKDRGWVVSHLPRYERITIPKEKLCDMAAAWVLKVEDINTGEDVTETYITDAR